jgi:lysyl-tRNA synthetase, class I
MHWADKVASEIIKSGKYKPYWVDDMKTPSGYAHIGSMLGPVVHSAIYRALKDQGKEVTLTYVFNDFDVADEFPAILQDTLDGHQGKALKMVPSPSPEFDNLADFLADDLKKSIEYLGFEAEYISSWELYRAGKFDEVIKMALDNSEKIQDIYQKISGSQKKAKGWLPFQVICEKCQKVGTTLVYAWDGEKVSYRCEPKLVTWAEGCGHEGKVSPFGGTGKLPWKVDWAAHWAVIGVTVEGAGKDHASKGGSYDIAMTVCKDIFKYPMPYKLPIEFLLIGGKKMSSSKGVGLKAHDLVKILPAEVARFMFINKDINKQSNFDPYGTMAIPDLFDDYDKCWEAYTKNSDEDLSRTFVLSQIKTIPEKEKGFFAPRFKDIANYLSQGLSDQEVLNKITEVKGGKIDDSELSIFEERVKYAKIWLSSYAPEEYRFELTEEVPDSAKNLSDIQKNYLREAVEIYNDDETAESLQISLYELTKSMNIPTKDAFAAIYLSLIGKTHGPRAGMLLLNIGKEKVLKRFEEINNYKENNQTSIEIKSDNTNYSISNEVKERYVGVSFAYTIIRDVDIKKSKGSLEKRKDEVLLLRKDLTTEKINEINSIKVYREMIKMTGIDYHSRRPSPDALLRRISQGKGLYTINTAVDAYNLAVIETGIGLGGFDFSKINEPVSLRFSDDNEEVFLLGDDEKSYTKKGELVYADNKKVLTIDLNYRDINETKITTDTKDIILFADGGPNIKSDEVINALKLGANNIIEFCGGKMDEIKLIK